MAENPNTPVDFRNQILEQDATDEESWVRSGVARHPNTPVELLEKLAKDKEHGVRHEVAHRLDLPGTVLAVLAGSRDSTLRDYALSHPNLPAEVLARSTDPQVRLIGLLRADCPVEHLAKNVRSADWRARFAIAIHPNTPPNTLKILAKDGDRRVRSAAARRIA